MKENPIKQKILEEYLKGQCGYKKLARKYNLREEKVGHWIREDNFRSIFEKVDKEKDKNFDTEDYDKLLKYCYKKHPELRTLIQDIMKNSKSKDFYSDEILIEAQKGDFKSIELITNIFAKKIFRFGYVFARSFGGNVEDCVQNSFIGFLEVVKHYSFNSEKQFCYSYGIFILGFLQRNFERNEAPFEMSKQQKKYLYLFLSNHKKTIRRQGVQDILDFISDEEYTHLKEESPYIFNYLSLKNTNDIDSLVFHDSFEYDCIYKLLQEDMFKVLSTLPPREQEVLIRRFGLGERKYSQTLDEVAEHFNVTRGRVQQIEAKALRRLRHPERSALLRDYMDN